MGGIKLFSGIAGFVLLGGLVIMLPLAWLGADSLESSGREYALRELRANAALAAQLIEPELAEPDPEALSRLLRRAKGGGDTRFTLIRADGRVLADSNENVDRLENHRDRPEVAAALAGNPGSNIRASASLGVEYIYAALPFAGGWALRASAALSGVDARLAQWWRRVVAGILASLAALSGLSLLAARILARPIEDAVAGAERFAQGDLAYRPPPTWLSEIRRLNAFLARMADELDSRFKLISRQRGEMRALFESMSEGVLAIDPDRKVMLLNEAARKLLHVSGNIEGMELETALRNSDLLDLFASAAGTEGQAGRELRLPGEGSLEETLVLAQATRIRFGEDDGGTLAVLRDVTHLTRLEMMRKDFIANVSHELRTPVTAIQSCLETIRDEPDGPEASGFLEMALKNTRRLGAIIGNLLLLAGMESGGKETLGEPAVCPVAPVIDEALSLCRESIEAREAALAVDCDPGLAALMNRRLVLHALVNLVDNAVKYGPPGGRISLEAARRGKMVEISISDQGPGISPRLQSRVFERFYRVNGSSKVSEGVGLGLALVKHIALAQGGSIELASDIGAGCTFKLSLPAE
ncbi:MAG: PAS domain-containing protein [Planctomycetota bacterium]|jgi:two-component system phosphate regulon sensor histidine kinase PhoR|nr:PAS domain-containing protein [Planctomycetota bacterium]